MGRSANFDPSRNSIRPATKSRIYRATTPENIGPSCDFDRLERAMDDYVIGLRGRSVLGYTVDRGTRPESTRGKGSQTSPSPSSGDTCGNGRRTFLFFEKGYLRYARRHSNTGVGKARNSVKYVFR